VTCPYTESGGGRHQTRDRVKLPSPSLPKSPPLTSLGHPQTLRSRFCSGGGGGRALCRIRGGGWGFCDCEFAPRDGVTAGGRVWGGKHMGPSDGTSHLPPQPPAEGGHVGLSIGGICWDIDWVPGAVRWGVVILVRACRAPGYFPTSYTLWFVSVLSRPATTLVCTSKTRGRATSSGVTATSLHTSPTWV